MSPATLLINTLQGNGVNFKLKTQLDLGTVSESIHLTTLIPAKTIREYSK